MREAPKGYAWKLVLSIVPGDRVLRWGDSLEVVDTHHDKLLVTIDCQDGEHVRSWSYTLDEALLVKESTDAPTTT